MAAKRIESIAVLTGGGDCPGLNAVIRAVVKTAINKYQLDVWGIQDGYLGLIENRMDRLSYNDVSNILTLGGTILGTSNIANPFRHAIKSGRRLRYKDVSDDCIRALRQRGIGALICIGGDGTMAITAQFAKKGLAVMGVPKTIDNDLYGTDVTFGFDTAVTTAAEAIDKVHTTASSHHRVMVVELMGRYAGWLALHAGVAAGADVILIPEIPFDVGKVAAVCRVRYRRGRGFTIIAAGEGARPAGGKLFVERVDESSPDPVRLGGVAKWVAGEVERATGLESRHIVLGHVQRGGTPTPHDRLLATRFGHHAYELAAAGRFGRLVVMQQGQIGSVPIAEVAGKVRTVPPDHPVIRAARAIGTSFGN